MHASSAVRNLILESRCITGHEMLLDCYIVDKELAKQAFNEGTAED